MQQMTMMIPGNGTLTRLRADQIIEVRIADDHVCTVESAQQLNSMINEIRGDKPAALLHIAGRHSSVGPGVREYMASEESQLGILANAIVIRSLPQRILGNFYLRVNKPSKPARLFTSQKEAEEWLRNFIPSLN